MLFCTYVQNWRPGYVPRTSPSDFTLEHLEDIPPKCYRYKEL